MTVNLKPIPTQERKAVLFVQPSIWACLPWVACSQRVHIGLWRQLWTHAGSVEFPSCGPNFFRSPIFVWSYSWRAFLALQEDTKVLCSHVSLYLNALLSSISEHHNLMPPDTYHQIFSTSLTLKSWGINYPGESMKAFLIWLRAPFLDKIPGMWETPIIG